MLSVETRGRVQLVTLDRAAARNAVNPALAQALFGEFMAFEGGAGLDVAVLTGSGGAFCAGFDLKSAAAGGVRARQTGDSQGDPGTSRTQKV